MSNSRPGRLNVGIVGAGRVGAVWGAALRAAGHRVVAASGISDASVTRIEALLSGARHTDPEQVVRMSDLVVLTVPDDDLEEVVVGLAALGAWRPGQLAAHASGRHGLGVLAAATTVGVVPLAMHPAMTFTGTSIDLARMAQAVFAVSAPATALPIAQALVVEMGGEPMVIDDHVRPEYHAAVVHGANHVATAVVQAAALLRDVGIDAPDRLLGPLVHASVEGALSDSPDSLVSLTGPVVRGDARTLATHVEALAGRPHVLAAYVAMAHATADLAVASGRLGPAAYAEVVAALDTGD